MRVRVKPQSPDESVIRTRRPAALLIVSSGPQATIHPSLETSRTGLVQAKNRPRSPCFGYTPRIFVTGGNRCRPSKALSNEEHGLQLVSRWFEEVWNQGKREVIRELFPEDSVLHEGSIEVKGPEEFEKFYDRTARPVLRLPFQDRIEFREGRHGLHSLERGFQRKSQRAPGTRSPARPSCASETEDSSKPGRTGTRVSLQAQLAERAATA